MFPIIKPSARAFFKEALRTKGYSLFNFVHIFFYGMFPYLYIGVIKGDLWPGKLAGRIISFWQKVFPPKPPEPGRISFADTYHGKVVPLSTAKQLVSVKENLQVSYPEQVIPYKLARELLLHDPTHITVIDCPCRVSKKESCKPLDVCLIVGEPFAGLVAEYHPRRARRISQEEAAQIILDEEQRGHVHHAFFKDAVLGRFYAICNCCACCCGAMQGQRNGTPMLASSGYICRVDPTDCLGCGSCVDVCQFNAIHMKHGFAEISDSLCMGCGVCTSHCPSGALALELAPWKGVPMTLPVSN